jgi:coenzyme F420-reducing hydrogenase beta subunit
MSKIMQVYAAYNRHDIDRFNSSSGGMFSAFASKVLADDGYVFGAVFDTDFSVVMKGTNSDITPMMGSKYLRAKPGTSFKDCEDLLEAGTTVLYTGTPCQIYGLKAFLKKDYENLYTVDIFCHGTPNANAWQRYLRELGKPIESVNFRDKRNGWTNYGISIKFKDGTELYESHNTNRYIQLFLNNTILNKSCFECKYRANSVADISIGDLWGYTQLGDKVPSDNRGLSAVVIHTEKGQKLVELADINKVQIDYSFVTKNNCIDMKLTVPPYHSFYTKLTTQPKIGIVTDQVYKNVGGILQAVSLSSIIQEYTGFQPVFPNQIDNGHLKYFDKHCKWESNSINDSYQVMVVGSDQVWNRLYCTPVPFNDKYCIHPTIKKVVYAASFGHHDYLYSDDEIRRIRESLKQVKYISTRELFGQVMTRRWFHVDSTPVLDPTMLHDANFYLNTINESPCLDNDGIFAYILDDSTEWQSSLNKLANTLGTQVLPFDGSCEQFISNMNKAKYVITDSYHGTVFSLIFNKPFITYRNVARGNDRFDDLCFRFKPIRNQFVTKVADICNTDLLNATPNVQNYILYFRQGSLDFLRRGLMQI